MHSWRDVTFFSLWKVLFGVLLSLGQSGGMTRFVSGRLVSLFLLLLSLQPSPFLTGREKGQTGSAALLPASTFT